MDILGLTGGADLSRSRLPTFNFNPTVLVGFMEHKKPIMFHTPKYFRNI